MSWVNTAKVGDKVTPLIEQGCWNAMRGEAVPVFGVVYTIRKIMQEPDGIYLWLVEIVNAPKHYPDGFMEVAFYALDFRPVETRPTDICVFTSMLKPADVRVVEVA